MKTSYRVQLAAIVAASAITIPAFALTSEQSKAVTATLKATKVVEVPARALEIVTKAQVEEQTDFAVAVVGATAKVRPSALTSTVTAVLGKVPSAAEKVVQIAVEFAPDSSQAIVQAAIAAVPDKAGLIAQSASRVQPAKAALFQRESVAMKSQASPSPQRSVRSVSVVSAAAPGKPIISQSPSHVGEPAPINLYAFPGVDPTRP